MANQDASVGTQKLKIDHHNDAYVTAPSGEMSVSLVDISTKQVHVLPLKRGGEVTIRDFITAVEERLTRLAQDEGTCVRVLCAAVGDSCINICDKLRSVQYYLLDAKPWFIKTGQFSSSQVDVHIKEINRENGNEAAIKMDLDKSHVKDLKQKFARMTGSFFASMHLVFDKKELENDKRLSDYNLTSGCVVPCISGGSRTKFGTPYVHISLGDTMEDGVYSGLSGLSPVWRRATPGMWLEGKCTNEICVARSKMVVMNQGYTDLDFVSEWHKSKCPMCYERVTPTMCGFNRCEWTTAGLKKAGSERQCPQVVRQDWQRQEGEKYHRLMPYKDNSHWVKFKVSCRQLKKFCGVYE